MSKTIYNGNYKDHDLTVTVRNPDYRTRLIESIEREALKQTPMTDDQMAIFNELKSYEFFVPFRDIAVPERGNGVIPNMWEIRAGYGQFDSHFTDVGDHAPLWIREVASAKDEKTKTQKFNFYFKKWVGLYVKTIETHTGYHLCKAIHDEVTVNGTKPIKGYHAPTPPEVLQGILPEKYKTSKKAS